MVAEHSRSMGSCDAMSVMMKVYMQPMCLLAILSASMWLHSAWILTDTFDIGESEADRCEDMIYTVDNVKFEWMNESFLDLAGWYRSVEWKHMSGVSETFRDADDMSRVDQNETVFCFESDFDVKSGLVRNVSHSAAVDMAVDLRAFKRVQIDSMLNASHGMFIADMRETVGVNELMIWHGMFLLLMYIIDGVSRCFSNFFSEKTYGDIAFRCISMWMDLLRFIPFRKWRSMSLVICIFIDGASAEGQMHWLWFAVFVIFFISQLIGYANMMKQSHARLSRKLKRKSHLSQRATRCKFKAVIWLTMIYTAKSMDGQVLNQVAELARAATQAATAATAIASQFSSRGSSSMESAVKVLKAPDVFTGDDSFMNWKTNFMSWIGYGDDRYLKLIPTVEKMTKAPDISTYKEEDKELAHKFYAVYAILSSYLRGRCSSLVRAESENRDGFKLWYDLIHLWYDLMHEFHPQTKQRTLSLAQTLASYPSFSAKQSMLENILNYETLVDQYEKSSGEKYPSDLKTATLLRCAPQKISRIPAIDVA